MNTITLNPKGILDHRTGAELLARIHLALADNVRTIWVDCTEISFVDSRGLSQLIHAHKAVLQAQGELILCNLSADAHMILAVVQLDQVLTIADEPRSCELAPLVSHVST